MSEEHNVDIFNIMLAMLGEDTEYYVGISIDDATDNGRYSFYFLVPNVHCFVVFLEIKAEM